MDYTLKKQRQLRRDYLPHDLRDADDTGPSRLSGMSGPDPIGFLYCHHFNIANSNDKPKLNLQGHFSA